MERANLQEAFEADANENGAAMILADDDRKRLALTEPNEGRTLIHKVSKYITGIPGCSV